MSTEPKTSRGAHLFKHGLCNTPTHKCWMRMRARCFCKSNQDYPNYGGRGITICERWRNSFLAFLEDMGEKPAGKSIDRIDNDGDYEPGNCRWSDSFTQSRNRRNITLREYNGATYCIAEAAKTFGVHPKTIRRRLRYGWSFPDVIEKTALTTRNYTAFGETKSLRQWAKDARCTVGAVRAHRTTFAGRPFFAVKARQRRRPVQKALSNTLRRLGCERLNRRFA